MTQLKLQSTMAIYNYILEAELQPFFSLTVSFLSACIIFIYTELQFFEEIPDF